jgi:hypothetical protein
MDAGDRWLVIGVVLRARDIEGADAVLVAYATREETFRVWQLALPGA